ncbi:MAG: TlpA family protein disulfide reductase [Ignavibacteriales bacterium]|nr:TlpA family protein disulfide reductase [Ignavibacteriales bacterium]
MNLFRIPFIALLSILLISGCAKKKEAVSENGSKSSGAANVSEISGFEKRGDLAPNFSWKDKDGKTISFDNFRGKVTLVNFWATWCGPCKRELPDLIALSKEMENEGVKVIGVSTDRGANVIDDVKAFVAEAGITYQIVISNEELEETYGNIRVIPTTFLIDADGKISQTIVGGRTKEQFAEAIRAILK